MNTGCRRRQHPGSAGQGLCLDAALEAANVQQIALAKADEVDVCSAVAKSRVRTDPGSELPPPGLRRVLLATALRNGHTHVDDPTVESSIADIQVFLARLGRHRQLERYRGRTLDPARDRTGTGVDLDGLVRPSQMDGQTHGTAGAVEAEIGGVTIGVVVTHPGAGWAPFEVEEPIGTERQTPPAPGPDQLRRRDRLGLYQG